MSPEPPATKPQQITSKLKKGNPQNSSLLTHFSKKLQITW